jgi:hypothetical protein
LDRPRPEGWAIGGGAEGYDASDGGGGGGTGREGGMVCWTGGVPFVRGDAVGRVTLSPRGRAGGRGEGCCSVGEGKKVVGGGAAGAS